MPGHKQIAVFLSDIERSTWTIITKDLPCLQKQVAMLLSQNPPS